MTSMWNTISAIMGGAAEPTEVTVCNTKYTCHEGAWKNRDHLEPGVEGKQTGCSTDVFFEIGRVRKCALPDGVSDDCQRSADQNSPYTVLTDPAADGQLYVPEVRGPVQARMPNVLPGTLRCMAAPMPAGEAGLVRKVGQQVFAAADEGPAAVEFTVLERPAPPPPSCSSSSFATALGQEPSPDPAAPLALGGASAEEPELLSAFPSPAANDAPAAPTAPGPAAGGFDSADSVGSVDAVAAPAACQWFSRKAGHGCATDSDCPLDDPFGAWWTAAQDKVYRGAPSKMTVGAFLDKLEEVIDDVRPEWNDTRVNKSGEGLFMNAVQQLLPKEKSLNKWEMGSRLRTMYSLDDKDFRKSVNKMLDEESSMQEDIEKARGKCKTTSAGVRKCGTRKVEPVQHALFRNSDRVVTFQKKAGSQTVLLATVQGDDTAQEVDVLPCDDEDRGDGAAELCRTAPRASGPYTDMLDPEFLKGPTADHYLVTIGEDDFVVPNRVRVPAAPPEIQKLLCADALCKLNADACPTPYCSKDPVDGTCAPVDHSKVELLDVFPGN